MTNDDLIDVLMTDVEESMVLLRQSELARKAWCTAALTLAEQLADKISQVSALKATVKELQAVIHEDAKQARVVTVVRKPIPQVH